VAIAVGDMLMLTLAEAIHAHETKGVFRKNHPGGAIGENAKRKAETGEDRSVRKKVG